MGTLVGCTIGSKGKKDHDSTFESNMIIRNIKEKKNNNSNNFNNNKDYKKIKVFNPNKYYNEWEKLKLWLF